MTRRDAKKDVESELRLHAPQISPDAFQLLLEMHSTGQLYGTESSNPVPIDATRISIAQGSQMNKLMRSYRVEKSLEVGFAFGFSTIWILDALLDQKGGFHQAIDPFEKSQWQGVGLKQVERLDNASQKFRWLDAYSIRALPKLMERQEQFDFVFVDGSHRFDDTLLEFYFADQLLRTGGLLAFDDMWMPSIRTVVSFILTNRDYQLVKQPVRNMAVLEKLAPDSRDWRHFNQFQVHKQRKLREAIRSGVVDIARRTRTYDLLRALRKEFYQ